MKVIALGSYRGLATIVLLLLSFLPLHAATGISGRVVDPLGAMIPGAQSQLAQ
jgi:hypothetical protein